MTGLLRAAAVVALLAGITTTGLPSQANARLDVHTASDAGDANRELRERQCRFQWIDAATWTAREERRTAECVVQRWGVEGGLSKLIAVGNCESGWYRFASNGGSYLGLFQHAASAWYWRVRSYMPDGWRVGPWTRWANSRSQIVTTVRMVNSGGWGPWTCA